MAYSKNSWIWKLWNNFKSIVGSFPSGFNIFWSSGHNKVVKIGDADILVVEIDGLVQDIAFFAWLARIKSFHWNRSIL